VLINCIWQLSYGGSKLKSTELLQSNNPDLWTLAQIVAFDAPLHQTLVYKDRHKLLSTSIGKHPHLAVVNITECQGRSHLNQVYEQVIAKGAEGIVLRNPKATYFEQDSFLCKKVCWIITRM
jgi:DNA ligase-1